MSVENRAALLAGCGRLDVNLFGMWSWRVYPDRVNVVLLDGRKFSLARPVTAEGDNDVLQANETTIRKAVEELGIESSEVYEVQVVGGRLRFVMFNDAVVFWSPGERPTTAAGGEQELQIVEAGVVIPVDAETGRPNYAFLTRDELRQVAAGRGLAGAGRLNKRQLVKALEKEGKP